MRAERMLAAVLTAALLAACSRAPASDGTSPLTAEAPAADGVGYTAPEAEAEEAGEPLDLTGLSQTMLYAEVGHINAAPLEYEGREIRMTGTFAAYEARDGMQFVCSAYDAAGCCFEPLQFVLREAVPWPEGYPEEGETITVRGTLETYSYNEYMTYCRLRDAVIEDPG